MLKVIIALSAITIVAACQGSGPDTELPQSVGCGELNVSSTIDALKRKSAVLEKMGRRDLTDSETEAFQFGEGNAARVAVTLSWGGPSGGGIVLVDCTGQTLSATKLGYVQEARLINATRVPTQELLVRYIAGTGTGWSLEETAVLSFRRDSVAPMWSGTTHERSYQSAGVGAYEINGSVELLGADTLVHRTVRVSLEYDDAAGEWRPREGDAEETSRLYVRVPASGRFELLSSR